MWERLSHSMEIVDFESASEAFYRDKYGISIEDYPYQVRKSLESLYFRGRIMPAATLYSKLARCGITLHAGSMLRTRLAALLKRVPPEPPHLSRFGGRAWHRLQMFPFNEEEKQFLVRNFPQQVQNTYPALFREVQRKRRGILRLQKQTPESPPGPETPG